MSMFYEMSQFKEFNSFIDEIIKTNAYALALLADDEPSVRARGVNICMAHAFRAGKQMGEKKVEHQEMTKKDDSFSPNEIRLPPYEWKRQEIADGDQFPPNEIPKSHYVDDVSGAVVPKTQIPITIMVSEGQATLELKKLPNGSIYVVTKRGEGNLTINADEAYLFIVH
jgi:hypothetical protein